MITLPETPAPNGANPTSIDFGANLIPPTGARELRVDRAGNRFSIEVSWPPMQPQIARVFISRLLEAKRKGVRIPYPLLESQSGCGSPVVDGAGQTGTTLNVRALTPGYAHKEGFWLSIEDAAGQHYLHNCRQSGRAGSTGLATFKIEPALRRPFLDGAAVHLAKPMIEGRPVGSEWSWQIPLNHLTALSVMIREVA